jgi:CRP-like cAMP-binding protein
MDLAKTLTYNYVFRGLPNSVVAGIAAIAEEKAFLGGDVLVRQYDRSSDLIVILEGNARIKGFHDKTIAEFGPGSVVGEVSLVDNQPRSATVVAVGNVKAAVINATAVRGMMDSDPEVARILTTNICKVLCRRLRTMNAQDEQRNSAA